jgi:hypothetical protein
MKRNLLIGLAVAILAVGLAVPALAHGTADGEGSPAGQGSWEAMYEACANGDWDAMAEAAEEFHEGYYGQFPCHGEGYYGPAEETLAPTTGWGGMGGHMGGGMTHGGWGGMMGWR